MPSLTAGFFQPGSVCAFARAALRPRKIVVILSLLTCLAGLSAAEPRWAIDSDGGITWKVKTGQAHTDNVEMSGKKVSVIVTYGVDDHAKFSTSKLVVFPTYRFVPVNTRSFFSVPFSDDDAPRIYIDRALPRNEVTTAVHHKGILAAEGTFGKNKDIAWTRTIFPSTDKPLVIEEYSFTNRSPQNVSVELEDVEKNVRTSRERGLDGAVYIGSSRVLDPGEKTLKPGETIQLSVAYGVRGAEEEKPTVAVETERQARAALVESYFSELQLTTPDPVLNTAFSFAKIRAAESIYLTKGGLMHGPGGGRYYAAIWANDQAEYANPFFAILGDQTARESAVNAYRMFAKYMNPEYKPIPSSIVAEGASTWHGAGDRGDMAMIAYGAARFSLANGDKETARELWPLVEWCLEYCHRKLNDQGVVTSDADELENRFPAGKANLCTSSLYFDALNSAALLGRELGQPEAALTGYQDQAKALRAAVEKYFGAKVEGFDTYRYYDGNTVLRAWICIPLTVGIYDRKDGTIAALFSPRLWTPDGLATQAGEVTFWDRSTLYALRGVFAAGETEKALDFLTYYSGRRLLGEHVPYPVEAYPEGNQGHLSAESALYCRIYTEGLFGIRPTGLRSFTCLPRLPAKWPAMKLARVHGFGSVFDLSITRTGDKIEVKIAVDGGAEKTFDAAPGEAVSIDLSGFKKS